MKTLKQLMNEMDDYLRGGHADFKADGKFNKKELQRGISHELEHTDNVEIAKEIAKDHLIDDKDYYKKLEKLEKEKIKSLKESFYALPKAYKNPRIDTKASKPYGQKEDKKEKWYDAPKAFKQKYSLKNTVKETVSKPPKKAPKNIKSKGSRNWHAVNSWFRTSAGPVSDKKKDRSKKACRGKKNEDC